MHSTNLAPLGTLAFLALSATANGQATPAPPANPIPPVPAYEEEAAHLVRRTSFGSKASIVQRLTAGGPPEMALYIDEQLDPLNLIPNDDPRVASLIALLPTPYPTIKELQQEEAIRQMFTERQLLEVMAYFFNVHFSVNQGNITGRIVSWGGGAPEVVELMRLENEGFRTHALGKFHDLLLVSSQSTAMRIYLNLVGSRCSGGQTPNEDYAREFLELHTVGAEDDQGNPNYDHDDIEDVAEMLTGWVADSTHITPYPPFPPMFDITDHCNHATGWILFENVAHMPDVVVAATPGDHEAEGLDLMWQLANHPQTARHVSQKLIEFFIKDGLDDANLLNDCVTAWGVNGGDINAVVRTILESAPFRGTNHRWKRADTPMESLVGQVRMFDADATTITEVNGLVARQNRMGQRLHEYPAPDGFSLESLEQTGSTLYMDRIIFAMQQIFDGSGMDYQVPALVLAGLNTVDRDDPAKVTGFLLHHMFQQEWTTGDLNRGIALVSTKTNGVPAPLDHVNRPIDWANRINLLTVLLTSIPQALKR